MATVALVMETALGSLKEGDIVHVDDTKAEGLISSGYAREATEEEVAEGANEEDTTTEDTTDNTPPVVEAALSKTQKKIEKSFSDAVAKTAEILQKNSTPPNVKAKAARVTVKDPELDPTGGFNCLGSFVQCAVSARKGYNTSAVRKMQSYTDQLRRKTPTASTIGGNSGHEGGDAVPQQWSKELWRLAFAKTVDLSSMCASQPMDTQVMNLPTWVQSSGTAGVTAAVIAENVQITATKAVTANVQLSLVKFAALVPVSDELLRFSPYALEGVIKGVVPQRIRYLMNDGIVNGTNSQVNLIGNAAAVVLPRKTVGSIEYDDITKMDASLFDDFADDAVWLTNNATVPQLMSIAFPNRAATTPIPAWTPGSFGNLLGPKPVMELLGRPVYRLENCPALGSKGDLVLVSFSAITCGKTELIADQTNALYFDYATDAYRFLWYADTVNRMNTVYTRQNGGTASNIIVLNSSST